MLIFRLGAAALVALVASVFVGPASAASYHSPGYKGTKKFRSATQKPLPPISLGTGKYPNLLVDGAGTAHIVFAHDGGASAPDTLAFCNLQRGIKTCASSGNVPNPQAPDPSQGGIFSGNIPSGNHDFDGPVPLAIGNQLFVVERRFPDVFNAPGSTTSDSNVFEWSSVDGGATITGPGQIGDNQMAGGAVAYGDPSAPSVGTISRTETGGTFFQGSPAGSYTTAKAQLGVGDQAYDGSLALDGTKPIAAFADLSGNVFVREWSGQGDPNDVATWSRATFSGYQPQIVGGASGVFVLYSDSSINGGKLRLRRIVGGQPSGAPVALGTSASAPAISEDPTGRIAFAYTDKLGVEVRSSSSGANFSPPQLTAALSPGGSIDHLVTAATTDGGGFVSFVRDGVGGEGVGPVIVSAFGTQKATGKPGLGPLPGGGIGSSVGDQLATSTCTTATFGVVTAQNEAGGCFAHDPSNPNLDVSLGEVNINGVRLIPDAGVRIGIDPKLHTIDTTGSVKVVLSGPGIDITLFHGELHAKIPAAVPGADLFDLTKLKAPLVAGFPIDGDVDIKLVKGGVQVPISLKLPGYFGGVTGSATLQASTSSGLKLSSLEFKIGDANFAALELKDVDVSYTLAGEVWKGTAKLEVPAGGSALSSTVSIEFDNGDFKSGSLDVGLPYPGIPLDDTDPPPQLYLSHGGLGLGLHPVTLSGTIGFGVTPIAAPGTGTRRDYAFSLDGKLTAAFGSPVTITVTATGFLYAIKLAEGTLTYKIPNQVTLTGSTDYDLGLLRFKGQLGAIIDPKDNVFGGLIKSEAFIKLPDPFSDLRIPSLSIAVNNTGFGVYIPPPGYPIPVPPFSIVGTIAYTWGDAAPKIFPYQDVTGRFTAGIPQGGAARVHAHAAAATGFTVPANAPTTSLVVHGAGGAPSIVLIGPDGRAITPDGKAASGVKAAAIQDPTANATYVGIQHPRAGRWTVQQASGSPIPVTDLEYSVGESAPKVRARLSGRGLKRTLHYHVTAGPSVAVRFAEKTNRLLHVIGSAKRTSGTIRFRPAFGPPGRRQLIAQITNNGLPLSTQTLGSFVAPRPPRPGKARKLRVRAGRRAFSFSFRPPANAEHTLLRIVATDGRHLQRLVAPSTRSGSLPVLGFRDGVTVTVIGVAADGSRGPAVKASAIHNTSQPAKHKAKKRRGGQPKKRKH
jgi:hypothetical protein